MAGADEDGMENNDEERESMLSERKKKPKGKPRFEDKKPKYPITDKEYGNGFIDGWEGDKFIWDEGDLEAENDERGRS